MLQWRSDERRWDGDAAPGLGAAQLVVGGSGGDEGPLGVGHDAAPPGMDAQTFDKDNVVVNLGWVGLG